MALALVLKERQFNGALLQTGSENEKIKAYLTLQNSETLATELVNILPRHPELKERLLLKAELAGGSAPLRSLKKTITRVTRPKHIWEYRKVGAYFQQIEATLENVASIADSLPPKSLLKTALYGIERVNGLLEVIDDSGGYRFTTQAMLRELHIKALQGLDWPPEQRAAHLLDFALTDPWDQFTGAPRNYIEGLGEEGLVAFYAEVEARLNAIPEQSADAKSAWTPRHRLVNYLRERAGVAEDWDALIEIEKREATDERDFRRIAELCLRKNDADGAAEWLTKADSLETRGCTEESDLWPDVHAARGDWDPAVDAQRRVFERDPSHAHFCRLSRFAAHTDRANKVLEETKDWLRARAATRGWQGEQSAFTLAQILRDEEDWEGSYEVVAARVTDSSRLLDAARWLAEPAPPHANELYAQVIETMVDKKNKRGYQLAVEVLVEAKSVFDAAGADAFENLVARLRETHKRKISFIARLDKSL